MISNNQSAELTPEALQAAVTQLCAQARQAAKEINLMEPKDKSVIINAIAHELDHNQTEIFAANRKDLSEAESQGLGAAFVDRLRLDEQGVAGLVSSLQQLSQLPDPIGEINDLRYQDNGIQVGKMRVPLGVIGIVYESRPNVTIDCAALCIKTSNACILRGGKEAANTNAMLLALARSALDKYGLSPDCLQMPPTLDHDFVRLLVSAPQNLDLLIPRGGRNLIEKVIAHSQVPVLKHLDGNCHIYVDSEANLLKAVNNVINSKTRRYGVCNALESLLLHTEIAGEVLRVLLPELRALEVEVRGCPRTKLIDPEVSTADEADYYREYLAPILSVKIVNSVDEAIEHINHYGSHHTDAIITEHYSNGRNFMRCVDSASVMWNVSTAFADGYEYGLGTEVGISTDKLHARGPVGLLGLTSEKYVVFGDGQNRR